MPQFAQGLRHMEYAYYYKVIVTRVNQSLHTRTYAKSIDIIVEKQ